MWSVPSRRSEFSTSRMIHRREPPRELGSSPIGMKNLVARTTSSRRPCRASPTISSDTPAEYTSAVSTKLIPASSARWMMRMESARSSLPHGPNIIAPRHKGLTCTPVRPSGRYCIGVPSSGEAAGGRDGPPGDQCCRSTGRGPGDGRMAVGAPAAPGRRLPAGKLSRRAAVARSGTDEDLERLAGVHRLVPGGDVVQPDGAVEDPAGLDAALEHVGQQVLDVGPLRAGAAGEGDVAAEEVEAGRRLVVLRDAAPVDHAAGAHDAEGLLVSGQVPDALQDGGAAVAAGELPNSGDALLAAGGDDVGGAELPAQVGARPVAAHQHDLLGAQPLGGQHREQADRAVADHRHRAAPATWPRTAAWWPVISTSDSVSSAESS